MKKRFWKVLWDRMKQLDLTYEELARRVGVSGVYISRIIQGKVIPSDEVIYRLSQALELGLDRLILLAHYEKAPPPVKGVFDRLSGHSAGEFLGEAFRFDNIEPARAGEARPVPVVGLVPAGEFMPSEDGGFPPGVADSYVYTDQKGRNLFATRVVNDSMEPEFQEGDILIVNPNLAAGNGDYVIAKLRPDNEVTFKKLVKVNRSADGISEPIIILRPLNSRYHDIVITDPSHVEIVGKVVEKKRLY